MSSPLYAFQLYSDFFDFVKKNIGLVIGLVGQVGLIRAGTDWLTGPAVDSHYDDLSVSASMARSS